MNYEEEMCQFDIDPSSINLSKRVSLQDPLLAQFSDYQENSVTLLTKQELNC